MSKEELLKQIIKCFYYTSDNYGVTSNISLMFFDGISLKNLKKIQEFYNEYKDIDDDYNSFLEKIRKKFGKEYVDIKDVLRGTYSNKYKVYRGRLFRRILNNFKRSEEYTNASQEDKKIMLVQQRNFIKQHLKKYKYEYDESFRGFCLKHILYPHLLEMNVSKLKRYLHYHCSEIHKQTDYSKYIFKEYVHDESSFGNLQQKFSPKRKLYVGPRGGRYYLNKGKKVYI